METMARRKLAPLDEEQELTLYAHAIDMLEAAGFEHYEISNFARPNRRCRHNQVYWANEAYFGFGMGAARYVNGRRELNTRDLQTYMKRVLAGEAATFQSETLEPEGRAARDLGLAIAPLRWDRSAAFPSPDGVRARCPRGAGAGQARGAWIACG